MIVQTELVVLATAPDHNMSAVTQSGAGQGEREVEMQLIGGKRLRGIMYLAPMQRMSDYLHQCGKFAGMVHAVLLPEQTELGELAVSTSAIATVAETKREPKHE
jgi:hypothetical protein